MGSRSPLARRFAARLVSGRVVPANKQKPGSKNVLAFFVGRYTTFTILLYLCEENTRL